MKATVTFSLFLFVLSLSAQSKYYLQQLNLRRLKAATTMNARALHREEEIGTIKPGRLADIVVVKGDPSKDISDTRKVQFVMKEGVVYRNEK